MTMLRKSAGVVSFLLLLSLPVVAQSAPGGGDGRQSQGDAGGAHRGPGGRRGGGVRGTVASVSGSGIVVKDDEGNTWTVITTDNTRVMRDRQPLAVSAIQPGDEVVGMGMPDADKHELHAMMVVDVPAAEVAKAKENLGKTYIVGRITAMDDAKLTVLRSDKVSQTIQLDDTTSLHRGGRMDPAAMQAAGLDGGMMGMGGGMEGRRRNNPDGNAAPPNAGGESITLADVKVGDAVVGLGSVKGGVFVPTDLRVQERRVGARRGNGGESAPPPQQ